MRTRLMALATGGGFLASDRGSIMYGAVGDDTLTGGLGDDILDGGLGTNTLAGGAGNDGYVIHSLNDVVIENPGEGTADYEMALVSGVTLAANVENGSIAFTTGGALTGNGLGNIIYGNAGADTLDGAAGADIVSGAAGDDVFIFRTGQANGDILTDFSGNGAGAGDMLQFVGFGSMAHGATFTPAESASQLPIPTGNTNGNSGDAL